MEFAKIQHDNTSQADIDKKKETKRQEAMGDAAGKAGEALGKSKKEGGAGGMGGITKALGGLLGG